LQFEQVGNSLELAHKESSYHAQQGIDHVDFIRMHLARFEALLPLSLPGLGPDKLAELISAVTTSVLFRL
jgi:hypothetical protein